MNSSVFEHQGDPLISVVINTYNRAGLVGRAIASVLEQDFDDFEVVVVDDGSTDDTASVVAGFRDPRLSYIRQENAGLTAARNAGIASTSGRWVTFIDDDDQALPGSLRVLGGFDRDPEVGIVCAGARFLDEAGTIVEESNPHDLGPMFEHEIGLFIPGCFSVRREILEASGRFLVGIPTSQQTELGVRLVLIARERGFRIENRSVPVLTVERREPRKRPLASPRLLVSGARWMLERHGPLFERDRKTRAAYEAIVGINAARIDQWTDARRYLLRSLLHQPASPRAWGRLVLAGLPPLGRRVWHADQTWSEHTSESPLLKVDPSSGPNPENLFLPWRYRENPEASSDARATPFWEGGTVANDVRYQDPVYRYAARLVRRVKLAPVVDIGCGSGHKLVHRIGAATAQFTGVDQHSAIAIAESTFPDREWITGDLASDAVWDRIAELSPRLVICADVIEHVEDPRALLRRLHCLAVSGATIVLSTPDRDRLGYPDSLGPPGNPRHIREWSMEGLALLVEAERFDVVARRHVLPRRYSFSRTELNRAIWRLLHLKAVPDRHSASLFVMRSAGESTSTTDDEIDVIG